MIGQTQDALTFTTNNFTTSGYVSSWAFAVSKARVYNGLGWGAPLFGVTYDTAPTQVAGIPIDTGDGRAYFAAPNDANNVIYVYAMTSAGYGNASLAFLGGAAYNWAAPPRRVNQPGTSTTLGLRRRARRLSRIAGREMPQFASICAAGASPMRRSRLPSPGSPPRSSAPCNSPSSSVERRRLRRGCGERASAPTPWRRHSARGLRRTAREL